MQYPNQPLGIGNTNCAAIKEVKKRLNLLHYPTLDENNCNFGDICFSVIYQKLREIK